MNRPTRARTQMECMLAEQRSCLGNFIAVAVSTALWLHPGLTSNPHNTTKGCAGVIPAPAFTSLAYAGGYDGLACTAPIPADVQRYLDDTHCTNQAELLALLEMARLRAEHAGITPMPLLLACCVARWETRYALDARGDAGERGCLQVHPCHNAAMRKAGLTPGNRDDDALYAMTLYSARGLKPWATRAKAQRDYEAYRGEK